MEKLQAGDPQSAGPYLLQGRLGADATGQVFLGWSPTSQPGGQQVAVKVIHPYLTAVLGFRTEFAREVAAVRQLTSPFLLPVVDADVSAPAPWLAVPFAGGMALATSVAVHGPLPPGAVLSLAAGLAEGLRTAHAAGVVHRSVKPDDVLLTADGPRLADLGLGEVLDRARASAPVGSAARVFQSPEQAKGLTAGPASDVYSLGMVLLYAAAGMLMSHYAAHLEQLPDELRSVIGPCLAAAPAERPAAAQVRESVLAAHPAAADLAGWLPAGVQPPAG
jgi:serine/threonine protein kinase